MYPLSLSSGNVLWVGDLARLQQHLRYAANRIPAYSAVSAAHDESPLGLLEMFPELEKADLIAQGESLYDLGARGTILFSETSGTTGDRPLVTPRSLEELRWNGRNLSKAFERHLARGLDRVAIVHPGLLSPFVEASTLALYQIGTPFLRIFPIEKVCSYERIVRVFRDYGITAMMTTPTLAAKLLFERQRLPKELQAWSVRKLLLTGEVLTKPALQNFGRLTCGDARAFVYGSSEAATCAFGCSEGHYHPLLDDFAYELRPSASGSSARAELVVTWLNTGVRPLVRYRTGDLVEHGTDCACGDPGVWFDVLGRASAESGRAPRRAALEEVIYSKDEPVYHYELALGRGEHSLVLIIDPGASERRRERIANQVAEACQARLDFAPKVSVNPEGHEYYAFAPTAKTERIVDRGVG